MGRPSRAPRVLAQLDYLERLKAHKKKTDDDVLITGTTKELREPSKVVIIKPENKNV